MRTKALLLAAAFAAAGVSTSVAQVYSVNAVGYVNVSLVPGFNLVSNPLNAGTGNNTVGKLFSNITGGVPAGLKVWTWNENTGGYNTPANYINAAIGFSPAASRDWELLPGNGAFVLHPGAPGAANLTLTFVGEVMQGNLVNPLPQGFSIKANQVPQAGKPSDFGFPGALNDKVWKFNKTTQSYVSSSYIAGPGWLNMPTIEVGEGFFVFKGAAGTWNRTFSVNG
jgi:hypothetical protein